MTDQRATLSDIELQAYYDRQFEMMASRAWKELMEDVRQVVAARSDPRTIRDWEMLRFVQGELVQCDWLLSREEAMRAMHDALLRQEAGAEE